MEMLKYAIVDHIPLAIQDHICLIILSPNLAMPIDQEFPTHHQVIGLHYHADGQHYHFMRGPGGYSNASEDDDVREAYYTRQQDLVPIGVHGTMVTVDWDSCVSDGSCL
jgi:NAD-dependent dihydropyrimidine dehydrogenase PreA subunit